MGRRKKDYSEAVRMYEAGASTCDIAPLYGVKTCTISRTFKRRGVVIRKRPYTASRSIRRKTNYILRRAIAKGLIERPSTCESCNISGVGKNGRAFIDAHHHDYNKPLDVMWLCAKCHYKWHLNNVAIPPKEGS